MGQARIIILALKPKIVGRKNIRQNSTMENQDSCSTLVEKPEEVPVENQSHHSVLSDHQLVVDGVIYRELKTFNRVVIQDGPNAGKEEQVLVHTRSMGNKSYTIKKINNVKRVIQENKMNSLELHTFQEVWEQNKIFQEIFNDLMKN